MSKVINVTNTNFEEIMGANIVLLDFWAPWCGPCRTVSPIIEELAEEFNSDTVKICKVNTDEERDLAVEFGIRSIPTIKIFVDGVEVETIMGAGSKDKFVKSIQAAIATSKGK